MTDVPLYIEEEIVKHRSKKKWPCKKNKGEHEWGEPYFKYEPSVRYIYEAGGCLDSEKLHPEYKLKKSVISAWIEVRCIHCGKIGIAFINEKIK